MGNKDWRLSALRLFSTKNHLFLKKSLLALFKNNEKSLFLIRFLPAAADVAEDEQAGGVFLCGRA